MHCFLKLKNFVPHEHGNCYIINFEKKSYLFKLGDKHILWFKSIYIATKADILEKLMIIITNNVKVLNI